MSAAGRPTGARCGCPTASTICWYAKDIAGNAEQEECEQGIHVDAAAPTAADGLSPADPNGSAGWYVSTPTISPSAVDTGGSGLQSVQQRLDGGPWQPAALTTLAEGTHTIEVRATDEAGNRSDPTLPHGPRRPDRPVASIRNVPAGAERARLVPAHTAGPALQRRRRQRPGCA